MGGEAVGKQKAGTISSEISAKGKRDDETKISAEGRGLARIRIVAAGVLHIGTGKVQRERREEYEESGKIEREE